MRRSALMIAGLLLATHATAGQPAITFEKNQITATGITPGSRVAFYGVAHDFKAVYPELLRWARERSDDDLDGTVTLEIPRDVPRDSQWFAVDLSTGDLAAASPRGDEPRERKFAGLALVDHGKSSRNALRVERGTVDLFVARAGDGGGSWVLLAGDGAAGDSDDGANGAVTASLAQLHPVGRAGAAPPAFAAADVAIVVDPFSLEYAFFKDGR